MSSGSSRAGSGPTQPPTQGHETVADEGGGAVDTENTGSHPADEGRLPARIPFTDRALGVLLTIGSAISLIAAFELAEDKIRLLQNPDYVPACNFSILMSCKSVISSPQGTVFGFPNPFMGLIGFGLLLGFGVAAAAGVRFPRWYWTGVLLGLTFAVGMVQWFAFQSIFTIEVLCPWCMVVWTMTVPMFWYTLLHVAGKYTDSAVLRVLRAWHLVPVVVWYLAVCAVILIHFWDYYWADFFAGL